jgi:predicted secreted Zn-dependent protease
MNFQLYHIYEASETQLRFPWKKKVAENLGTKCAMSHSAPEMQITVMLRKHRKKQEKTVKKRFQNIKKNDLDLLRLTVVGAPRHRI